MANMVKGVSWLILQIEMGHLGGWGTWVMGHMANGVHGHNVWAMAGVSWLILQIEMGHLGGWGTWVMGYMANGAHRQWGTWV